MLRGVSRGLGTEADRGAGAKLCLGLGTLLWSSVVIDRAGGGLRVISEGVSLRFKENRFRRDDLCFTSGGEEACGDRGDLSITGEGAAARGEGGLGEGTGLYVWGLRMKSGSGIASNSEGEELWVSGSGSGSGDRSRSSTMPNAGRAALIAGVIGVGSVGRSFNIDCRICRDCRGESD